MSVEDERDLPSIFVRDRLWKKLVKLLRETPLEDLLCAINDVQKIQSEKSQIPQFIRNVPNEWYVTEIGDPNYFFPWRLETLANLGSVEIHLELMTAEQR